MTAPNMAAITASLERSLQSFSLNHHSITTTSSDAATSVDFPTTRGKQSANTSDATLELNSNMTLPYHWEQCLDLKTGEMYYINWRTGMKSKEDPRTVDDGFTGCFYSDDDDADDKDEDKDEPEDDESSCVDSEGSSVKSSPAASSSRKLKQNKDKDEDEGENESRISGHNNNSVLVVAGCKGCFMYFMVPKQVEDCPKCCGLLLHFDLSDDS